MYKEYTRPLEQQIDTDKNIFSVLEERVNRTPNDSLVEYKNEHGEWASFSATEFRDKVIAIANGNQVERKLDLVDAMVDAANAAVSEPSRTLCSTSARIARTRSLLESLRSS